ncbi:NADH-dependent dehydrogenase [Planctomycetales bacterium 10988]|nr:NADH-dependent dehydrogenase [Planctomycetales bacterium 10988]
MSQHLDRRQFLQTAAAGTVAGGLLSPLGTKPGWAKYAARLDQPVIGCIGLGTRWNSIGPAAMKFGPCAALCDVDKTHLEKAAKKTAGVLKKEGHQAKQLNLYEDYHAILDRDDINVVVIGTPDHWHTKMAVDALAAGKHVYCEKPLTLTMEEGQLIRQALKKSGKTFQVGTQQRSTDLFIKAIALVQDGRIGELKKITCAIGAAPTSPSLPVASVPQPLNWDQWLGQAPMVKYREGGYPDSGYGKQFKFGRAHAHFRWWYEYSGGRMTDWGAHHVDIALLAAGKLGQDAGKVQFTTELVKHPVPFKDGMPTKDDQFNTATDFHVIAKYDDGLEVHIRHNADDLGFENGIMFEGTKGRFFVNRGKLTGRAVEELKDNPLPSEALRLPEERNSTVAHMANFIECCRTGETPTSDAESHHRALSICHVANISLRLEGRPLTWDTASETILGDEQASSFLSRKPRKGFEITV